MLSDLSTGCDPPIHIENHSVHASFCMVTGMGTDLVPCPGCRGTLSRNGPQKTSGTEPEYSDSSEIGAMGRTVGESISKVDLRVQQRKENTEVNVILQAGKMNPAPATVRSPEGPSGNIAAETTLRTDTGNRQYYRLVEGPYFLSKTTSNHRSITNFPIFADTGATFTYWYRHTANTGTGGTCKHAFQNSFCSEPHFLSHLSNSIFTPSFLIF